jgi:hypothetical protein
MKNLIGCVLLFLLVGCGYSGFIPEDVEIPVGFETGEFKVRPITVADAEKDYEAVMESIAIIHARLLDDGWPTTAFSLEENRKDMERKERRRERRSSFTYAVVSPDESRVLGSVYINEGIGGPDAAVFLWVRKSEEGTGLDSRLEAGVRKWIGEAWPFDRVVYPGRGQSVLTP